MEQQQPTQNIGKIRLTRTGDTTMMKFKKRFKPVGERERARIMAELGCKEDEIPEKENIYTLPVNPKITTQTIEWYRGHGLIPLADADSNARDIEAMREQVREQVREEERQKLESEMNGARGQTEVDIQDEPTPKQERAQGRPMKKRGPGRPRKTEISNSAAE